MQTQPPSLALKDTLERPGQNLEAQQILARVGAELFGGGFDDTGRYELRGKLGAGGMGVVYAAYDPLLDCEVAVKQLHSELVGESGFIERLRGEARAMARLRSEPHVVTLYDFFVQGRVVFVVMELVRGTTLRAWQGVPRRIDEVLAIYEQAGLGLVAAHRAGLVHRDFKPENVLIDARGVAKVSDFGLAHSPRGRAVTAPELPDEAGRPAHASASAASTRGDVAGTPRYMAPEQLRGAPVDPRCDQFSFCVALWEALFDEHPFFPIAGTGGQTTPSGTGTELSLPPSPFAFMHATLDGPLHAVPAGSDVPPRVLAALARGLAKAPQERFPSLEALLAALRPPPPRRRVAPWLALTGVLMGAAVWATRPAPEPPPPTHAELLARAHADITAELTPDALPAALPPAVGRELARYTTRWAEQTAGLELRLQQFPGDPDALTRLRCLADARHSAGALVDGLRNAGATYSHAVELVEALPSPEACGTMAADRLACAQSLSRIGAATEALPVLADMDAAARLEAAGEFPGALARAAAAAAAADELAQPLLRGQSHYLHGRLLYLAGRGDEAVAALLRARDAVEPTGCIDMRAEIHSRLIKTTAMYLGAPPAPADEWSRVLMILARATPDGGARRADAYNERGLLRLLRHGDPRGAVADFEQAIALRERVLGGRPGSDLADTHLNLAIARTELGDLDGAERALDDATRMRVALYGPDHPLHYRELKARAEILLERDEPAVAEAVLLDALARVEAGISRDGAPAARILLTLARAREGLGRQAQARADAEEAARRVTGASIDPSERLELRLAAAAFRDGPDLEDSLSALSAEAEGDPQIALSTRALLAAFRGEHAFEARDAAAAARQAEHALDLLARAGYGPDSPLSARVRRLRGFAAGPLGEPDIARTMLDPSRTPADPVDVELTLVAAYLNRNADGDRALACARLRTLLAGPRPDLRERAGPDLLRLCKMR